MLTSAGDTGDIGEIGEGRPSPLMLGRLLMLREDKLPPDVIDETAKDSDSAESGGRDCRCCDDACCIELDG